MRSFQPVQPLKFPARLLGGITTGCVVAFAVLAGLVASHWPVLRAGDQAVDAAAHGEVLRQHWLLVAARTATAMGNPVVLDVVAAVAVAVLLVKRWRGAVVVALARVGELVCESVVKVLIARPRPALVHPVALASGYSFPSGHAGGSAAVYGALVLVVFAGVARWARLMLATGTALLIGAVAVSRVLLGVHYPSDVAAGLALGLAWASGATLVTNLPRRTLPPDCGLPSICRAKAGGTNDHRS